jgi:AcrR family transcriptional regulator
MPGGGNAKPRLCTPGGEFTRPPEIREAPESGLAGRIMEAMLEVCGERGYRGASVQRVIDHCGATRRQFYAHFSNKPECYADAYEIEVDRRFAALTTAAGREDSWAEAVMTALREMAELLEKRPALAKGLLVEVHVAGGRASRKRSQVMQILAHALDRASSDEASLDSPPPVTSTFLLCSIESFITTALLREAPHEFAEGLRELAEMVLSAYFGREAAVAQLDLLLAA